MSLDPDQRSPETTASGGSLRSTGFSVALWALGSVGTGCIALAFIFCNCAAGGSSQSSGGEHKLPLVVKMEEWNEHRKGPIPESEWNRLGLWRRISDQPPAYVPKSYGRGLPHDDRSGKWMVDQRDGKRLFIPHGGTDGIPEAVLIADARKATQWKPQP